MAEIVLLNAVTATGAGPAFRIGIGAPRGGLPCAVVKVKITDTATVQLQGDTNDDDGDWIAMATYTSTSIDGFDSPFVIRGNVTAYTSGAVTMKVSVPDEWRIEEVV